MNKLAFLALVASYIDKDWKLHDVLVDFIELQDLHTGSNLAQVIYESVKGLRIQDQVRDTHNPPLQILTDCKVSYM